MADNSAQGGADTIRDKDRAGVKTQILGLDVNIGGAEVLMDTTHPMPVNLSSSAGSASRITGNLTASAASRALCGLYQRTGA